MISMRNLPALLPRIFIWMRTCNIKGYVWSQNWRRPKFVGGMILKALQFLARRLRKTQFWKKGTKASLGESPERKEFHVSGPYGTELSYLDIYIYIYIKSILDLWSIHCRYASDCWSARRRREKIELNAHFMGLRQLHESKSQNLLYIDTYSSPRTVHVALYTPIMVQEPLHIPPNPNDETILDYHDRQSQLNGPERKKMRVLLKPLFLSHMKDNINELEVKGKSGPN